MALTAHNMSDMPGTCLCMHLSINRCIHGRQLNGTLVQAMLLTRPLSTVLPLASSVIRT